MTVFIKFLSNQKSHFPQSMKHKTNFSQKLINKIVFLYFIDDAYFEMMFVLDSIIIFSLSLNKK